MADFKDDVGFTALVAEPITLPDGSGETVMQVEAKSGDSYMPDLTNDDFLGKTINERTAGENVTFSSHSDFVGEHFYGIGKSLMPQTDTIDVFESADWQNAGYLRTGNDNLAPKIEAASVHNFSWIGSGSSSEEILQRLDFAIERDGYTAVVGVNNGGGSVPELLASGYNSISVGLSNGTHSAGTTSVYGSGRQKPEIVAPHSFTSYSTPIVGSAALLLQASAKSLFPADADAHKPDVVKAILLAGATKEEFVSDWDRTASRPIDDVYGAGELNIQKSYHILNSGRHQPYPATIADGKGWARESITAGNSQFYFFEVPSGDVVSRLSIMLTWNRDVDFNIGSGPSANPLAELSLKLHRANAADPLQLTTLLDESDSSVDNLEHIYIDEMIEGGFFAIEVIASGSSSSTDYALAWRSTETTLSSYANWSAAIFENYEQYSSGDIAESGDPDGDGVNNLLEYAFNSSPLDGTDAVKPVLNLVDISGDDYLTLSYKVRTGSSGLSYHVDWSTDLSTWDQTGNDIVEVSNVPSGDGYTNSVTSRLDLDLESLGSRVFLRLRVESL